MRLEPQTNVPLNNSDGYAYSFWFYDPYATAGDAPAGSQGVFLQGQTGGQVSGMTIDVQHHKLLKPRTHGNIISADSWYDSSIVTPAGSSSFNVSYEPLKLNHFLFLKKNGTSMEVWFNGKKVAYNTNTVGYYPDGPFDWIIDPINGCFVSIGDLAYWHEDISDIAPDIYNNGIMSNWMNLSKKPKHYWRLGESSGSKIYDIGTDGTNHLGHALPVAPNYILASVTGTNGGYKFGTGYFTNVTDPIISVRVGDAVNFRNDTGGHPLAIKDSNDNIVAEEDSVTKKTRWVPTSPGIYRYYCTAHPDTMGAELIVYDKNFAHNNIITAVQE